jgi:hypothetical protein
MKSCLRCSLNGTRRRKIFKDLQARRAQMERGEGEESNKFLELDGTRFISFSAGNSIRHSLDSLESSFEGSIGAALLEITVVSVELSWHKLSSVISGESRSQITQSRRSSKGIKFPPEQTPSKARAIYAFSYQLLL